MNDVPRVLDQHNKTRMFVSENRLSRPYHDGLGWVIGASFIDNRARQDREYAYGPAQGLPDSKVGTFPQDLYDAAQKNGWVVISMKNDWKQIFAFDK